MVVADDEGIEEAARRLKENKLVAFPTETVYGLGANALSKEAILKIFEAKQRPLTDPLIVHVSNFEEGCKYVEFESPNIKKLAEYLALKLWPGPLTMILRAKEEIPDEVTASTGFVGIRVPESTIAQKLLQKCKLPIAAPSANRFGHVSPTKSGHVYSDLSHYDLLILENDEKMRIGIESTVIKLEIINSNLSIQIFRQGGVSVERLKIILSEFTKSTHLFVQVKNIAEPSPGQEITHYSPELDTFMFNKIEFDEKKENLKLKFDGKMMNFELKKIVLIDFFQQNISFKESFLEYYDLCKDGDVKKAAQEIYSLLRKAEEVEKAKFCLIFNPNVISNVEILQNKDSLPALFDRLFRSCSGRISE